MKRVGCYATPYRSLIPIVTVLLALNGMATSFSNQNHVLVSKHLLLNNDYMVTTRWGGTKISSRQPYADPFVHRETTEKLEKPNLAKYDGKGGIATNTMNKKRRSLVKSVARTSLAVLSNWALWDSSKCISRAADADFEMITSQSNNKENGKGNQLMKVTDPNTYSALVYEPPVAKSTSSPSSPPKKLPLLVVLHGAGTNERDVWNLADIKGEHAGLVPSLIQAGKAPSALTDNFVMVAPYCGQGKRSFYEEPRSKILQFINWFCSSDAASSGGRNVEIDTNRIYLFGFSDGATEVVELLTTGRFKAGIVAAYGFTGTLPPKAVDRLKDIPIWVFHSQDDVIFPVKCSDKLVDTLNNVNSNQQIVRYSRFKQDQEGFTGSVRGHSTGVTASKSPEVYEWLLSL